MRSSLEKGLLAQIETDANLLTTGIIGAKLLLPILHSLNATQLSLNLIKGGDAANASYPSWAWEGQNAMEPATAVWELWDAPSEGDGMNSRNHHMFSSVSAYLNTD